MNYVIIKTVNALLPFDMHGTIDSFNAIAAPGLRLPIIKEVKSRK